MKKTRKNETSEQVTATKLEEKKFDPQILLRTCDKNMGASAYRLVRGEQVNRTPFIWQEGVVNVAEDYDPRPVCGGGLHGLLNGVGDWGLLDWNIDAKVFLFRNVECDLIDIDGKKVKCEKAEIIEFGALPDLLAKTFIPQIFLNTKIADDAEINTKTGETIANRARWACVANSGDSAKVANSGYSAQVANSGDSAKVANSGDSAKVANSGDSAKVANSGDSAKVANSGYSAQVANSGDSAKVANSGYSAQVANSGDSAKVANSGDSAKVANSGYSAKVANSGDWASLEDSGKNSITVSCGFNVTAKIGEGGALALSYKDTDGKVRVAVGYEGEGLKRDVWYKVNEKGEFYEA